MPAEFEGYAGAHPKEGMPLAVTGLTDQQYQTLQRWLASGAPIDEQGLAPSAKEALQIVQWENLLNTPGARQSLVGRWLYEHWFLAHLYFKDGEPGHYFQWVRSRTPTGQPIDLIATRRPNDDPGTQVYYRLWPVQGRDRAQDPHHLSAERGEDGAGQKPVLQRQLAGQRLAGVRTAEPGQPVCHVRGDPGAGALSVHAR